MAIQINLSDSDIGVGFPTAYARVQNISFSRQRGGGTAFRLDVVIYAQAPGGKEDLKEVLFKRYQDTLANLPAGANPINRAYDYLKTLPEFSGGLDV